MAISCAGLWGKCEDFVAAAENVVETGRCAGVAEVGGGVVPVGGEGILGLSFWRW